MPGTSTTATQLRSARRSGTLVRFRRPFEEGSVHGYVLDVGPEFFLLALVSDQIRFNGFQCFRTIDVRDLRPDPSAAFVKSALKRRRECKPDQRKVSVRSLRTLLLSASKSFPLVTIHREKLKSNACQVGHVVSVASGKLRLLEIRPSAVWADAPTHYNLKQITRVDFGGDYEDALHLVGGDPPAGRRSLGFINVDLDVASAKDLRPLMGALEPHTYLLERPSGEASFEINEASPKDPEATILEFIRVVKALPPAARKAWDAASKRVFDIGLQSGRHPFRQSYNIGIETLRETACIGADIAITLYALDPTEDGH